jgi:hypothetical protein
MASRKLTAKKGFVLAMRSGDLRLAQFTKPLTVFS